jgi:hypothetical protein
MLLLLRQRRRQLNDGKMVAAAAKRRQNGGGGEPKSYRVTISAPIIFHCRSTYYIQDKKEKLFKWMGLKKHYLTVRGCNLVDVWQVPHSTGESGKICNVVTSARRRRRRCRRRHLLLPQCSRRRCLRTDTHFLHSRTIVCQKECTFW